MFVESYGQVAVQGSSFSPQVDAALARGTKQLQARRLLRPQRLPDLDDVRRHQLAGPLQPAVGTLGRQPAPLRPAHHDQPLHAQPRRSSGPGGGPSTTCRRTTAPGRRGRRSTTTTSSTTAVNVGYHGPTFAYASMPDQYVMRGAPTPRARQASPPAGVRGGRHGVEPRAVDPHPAADRLEQGRQRLDLQHRSESTTTSKSAFWSNSARVQAAYGKSIEYTMNALISFVQHYRDPNLVLIVLGDHQPWTIVSGLHRESRRADLDHRPRPGGAEADRRLGLERRPAAQPERARLADERLPQPFPAARSTRQAATR